MTKPPTLRQCPTTLPGDEQQDWQQPKESGRQNDHPTHVMEARVAAVKALSARRQSTRGDRRAEILEVARDLMVSKGLSAVTIRGVARAAGMAPGNLGYYFKNHDDLLQALLDWMLDPYLRAFEFLRADAGDDHPEDGLRAVLDYVLEDLAQPETTMFFPELWVLANRDTDASAHMRGLYEAYLGVLRELIAAARPDLSAGDVEQLALFICASIEGQTVFIGHQRPYAAHRRALKSLALDVMMAAVINHAGGSGANNTSNTMERDA